MSDDRTIKIDGDDLVHYLVERYKYSEEEAQEIVGAKNRSSKVEEIRNRKERS